MKLEGRLHAYGKSKQKYQYIGGIRMCRPFLNFEFPAQPRRPDSHP